MFSIAIGLPVTKSDSELNSKLLEKFKIISAKSEEITIPPGKSTVTTVTADFGGFKPMAIVDIFSLSTDTYVSNRYGLSRTSVVVKNINSGSQMKTTIYVQYLCTK